MKAAMVRRNVLTVVGAAAMGLAMVVGNLAAGPLVRLAGSARRALIAGHAISVATLTVLWLAPGWRLGPAIVLLALVGLSGSIWLGLGFILGSTLLFAFTARAFGRRALLADLVIGVVIATLIFLMFNKLLKLALPMGPLERLF